jgi:uncharacterized protein YbjT (DUF2867 family)
MQKASSTQVGSGPEGARTVAVVGATGLQGGGVLRALRRQGRFRVRALTRHPERHGSLAEEVVRADLSEPESLKAAFAGAYAAFVVTNFWEPGGVDELQQGRAAVEAAQAAGVEHFIWSTLPNVEAISGGGYRVPHFSGKARVEALVEAAAFPHWTFVEPPFYFQNFQGQLAPRPLSNGPLSEGRLGWALPIDPAARCIHMGDVTELGSVVAGALAYPERAGRGQHLALAGGLLSFDDVIRTLAHLGHELAFERVPRDVFAQFFPGADEMADMLAYFEDYTYLGPEAEAKIALARELATAPFTDFATWAGQYLRPA